MAASSPTAAHPSPSSPSTPRPKPLGVVALGQKVLAEEGIGGFYTGLSSGLAGMGLSWFTYYYWFNFLSDLARRRAGPGVAWCGVAAGITDAS